MSIQSSYLTALELLKQAIICYTIRHTVELCERLWAAQGIEVGWVVKRDG